MAGSSQFYSAKEGDMLDAIVLDHYGALTGDKVEAVLAANPGLAALGPVLPIGTVVELPNLADAAQAETVSLWG